MLQALPAEASPSGEAQSSLGQPSCQPHGQPRQPPFRTRCLLMPTQCMAALSGVVGPPRWQHHTAQLTCAALVEWGEQVPLHALWVLLQPWWQGPGRCRAQCAPTAAPCHAGQTWRRQLGSSPPATCYIQNLAQLLLACPRSYQPSAPQLPAQQLQLQVFALMDHYKQPDWAGEPQYLQISPMA